MLGWLGMDTADFKSSNYGYLPRNPAQVPGYPPAQDLGFPPAQDPGYPPAQEPGYPPSQGPGYPSDPGQQIELGYPSASKSLYPPLGSDLYQSTSGGYPMGPGYEPPGFSPVYPEYPTSSPGLPYPPSAFSGSQGASQSPWKPLP